jgi:hypothetical protein
MKWMVIAQALSALGFLVLAMIIVALFTPQLGAVSSQIEKKPFNSFWWGVLFAVLLFPVTLILVISLVGIIFLPVWALLVVAASVFGYIAVSHVIGKKLLHALKLKSKPMMWEVVIGLCALWLVGLIPVLGCLIQCLACTCGFGAATLKRLGTV